MARSHKVVVKLADPNRNGKGLKNRGHTVGDMTLDNRDESVVAIRNDGDVGDG